MDSRRKLLMMEYSEYPMIVSFELHGLFLFPLGYLVKYRYITSK